MNIHDCHVDICAFLDVIPTVDKEALKVLATVNTEWSDMVGPVMDDIKCAKVAEFLSGAVLPNGTCTVNRHTNVPTLHGLDIKLGHLVWLLKTFDTWNTRAKGSRRPVMRRLFEEDFFKIDKVITLEATRETVCFLLDAKNHPFIMQNIVNRVAWTYLIFVYIGLTFHYWTEHPRFVKSVLKKIPELRRDIKGKTAALPDDLRYHFAEVLKNVEEVYTTD